MLDTWKIMFLVLLIAGPVTVGAIVLFLAYLTASRRAPTSDQISIFGDFTDALTRLFGDFADALTRAFAAFADAAARVFRRPRR